MRGFGEYRAPFASGVDGDQLVDTLHRNAVSQRHDLFRIGFLFFLTERMRNAIDSSNFGPYDYSHEEEDCILSGDFRGQPRDQLEAHHPSHTKPVRRPPVTISEFQVMSNRQSLIIEAVYGTKNGDGRRRATEFFAALHRDSPEADAVDFIVDVWERTSIDYMESTREGIRSMGPYSEDQTTKIGMREVALPPMYKKTGRPERLGATQKRGQWIRSEYNGGRTILPEVERARNRNSTHVAHGRNMARRQKGERRMGA